MQVPLRDLSLRRLWGGRHGAVRGAGGGAAEAMDAVEAVEAGQRCASTPSQHSPPSPRQRPGHTGCALPLLQVWPSQDSPRGEADGQSFVFPNAEPLCEGDCEGGESVAPQGPHGPLNPHGLPLDIEGAARRDSGIDSTQASPSPGALPAVSASTASSGARSPSPGGASVGAGRRPSSALLHPAHALRPVHAHARPAAHSPSPELPLPVSGSGGGGGESLEELGVRGASCSSSTTSSMTSVAATGRTSDPWLQVLPTERRRSSTMTARYSLLDALDLEYVLLRAAARGSVGPYSLSESLHKLTFTQSLAFPALARGLAGKRRRSGSGGGGGGGGGGGVAGGGGGGSGVAKALTALVLMLLSVLVFGAVYKFTRT